MLTTNQYRLFLTGIEKTMRVVQVSDVHFSVCTTQQQNRRLTEEICRTVTALRPDVIAVTGDLVSRDPGKTGIADAVHLMRELGHIAPVLFTMGNHEMELSPRKRRILLQLLQQEGICLLNNRTVKVNGVTFAGLVLPTKFYRGEGGGYRHIPRCEGGMIRALLGKKHANPTILLAHSPMAVPAYAAWGADVVLAGHVHGGIIRLPKIGGLLSPERRFFPQYTKGMYHYGETSMLVSAGIGKLRLWNPPEVVCLTLCKR